MINNNVGCVWLETTKEDTQTCTQTSSELALERIEQPARQEGIQEDSRKNEHRLKYRKLRQKLILMGFQHDEKCVMPKDASIPKKQRIKKLALDFEKLVKPQNRDYQLIELNSKEIAKCIQNGNELELQLLGQSRFIPALFEFLPKVPSLHRVEFHQLLPSLELCFKSIYSFATLTANREYLILTNRLNGLVSFIGWLVAREDRKAPSKTQINILCMGFRLINQLLLHKSKENDIILILEMTVELILCSPIIKKIKGVLQQLIMEDSIVQTQISIEMLKFLLYIFRKSTPKFNSPLDSLQTNCKDSNSQTSKQSNSEHSKEKLCLRLIQYFVPFFVMYFSQLFETETLLSNQELPQSFPTVIQVIMGMVIKTFNCSFQISFFTVRKSLQDLVKEQIYSNFLQKIKLSIKYCKRQMQEFNGNGPPKHLLNELLILLGYLSIDQPDMQKRLYQSGVLEQAFNLPVQYIMDGSLRDVYIPSFCCMVNQSKSNLNLFLKQNSPQPLLKALKRQITARPTLQRKNSTSSLMSLGATGIQYNSINYETHRLSFEMRFPEVYWQTLCAQLQKHV